jgi:hypothetical protein
MQAFWGVSHHLGARSLGPLVSWKRVVERSTQPPGHCRGDVLAMVAIGAARGSTLLRFARRFVAQSRFDKEHCSHSADDTAGRLSGGM